MNIIMDIFVKMKLETNNRNKYPSPRIIKFNKADWQKVTGSNKQRLNF